MLTLEHWITAIHRWQFAQHYENEGRHFQDELLIAYRRADFGNRGRIDMVFPELKIAMDLWNAAGDNGNNLFREYNLPV